MFSKNGIEKAGRRWFSSPALRCTRGALKQFQTLSVLMLPEPDSHARTLSLRDQEWCILSWPDWLVPKSLIPSARALPSSTSPDCFLRRSTLRSWVHFFLETSLGGEGREDAMWGVHRVCCPSMWLTFSSRVGRDVLLSSDQTPWYLSHHKPKQPIPLCSWLHSAAVTAY